MAQAIGVGRSRIIEFLVELDSVVTKDHYLFVIGGSAITLGYSPDNRTSDIDTVILDDELETLGGRDSELAAKHGVYLSALHDITFSAPKDWRQRSRRQDLPLVRIVVYAADPNDIVLGKMSRLEPRDFEDIQALFTGESINADSVLNRLNQNLHEVEVSPSYRSNAILLFAEIFGRHLVFRRGHAVLDK